MSNFRKTVSLVLCAFFAAVVLSACASQETKKGVGSLQSSSELTPDASIKGAFIYKNPNINFAQYRKVILDGVRLYEGPEANFGKASPTEKQRYADLVDIGLRRAIAKENRLVSRPGPDVIRIRPTLIGVRSTVGGAATLTRIIPIGAAINVVRGTSGSGGTMTGGIELAVEIYDSRSNRLLASAVRQINPGAFDFGATLSTEKTVEAAAADAGRTLQEALDRNLGK